MSVSPLHAEGANSGYALILPLVERKSQAETQLNQSDLVVTNPSCRRGLAPGVEQIIVEREKYT